MKWFVGLICLGMGQLVMGQSNSQGPSETRAIERSGTVTPRSLLSQPVDVSRNRRPHSPGEGSSSQMARIEEAKAFYEAWHAEHPEGIGQVSEQTGEVPVSELNTTSDQVLVESSYVVTPSGNNVPDNSMGINSMGMFVTAINHRIQFFSEQGSTLLDLDDAAFFAELGPDQLIFDPRVLHATTVDRFIIMALHGTNSEDTQVLLAISSSPDPMDPWHYYSFAGNTCPTGETAWLDYPNMSATATEIFITANVFQQSSNTMLGSAILQLDMLAGMEGNTMALTTWCLPEVDGEAGRTLVPAKKMPGMESDDIWFVNTHIPSSAWPTSSAFHYWHITGKQSDNPDLEGYTIAIPNAPLKWGQPIEQPDGNLLLVNDLRVRSAFFHDGEITLALAAAKTTDSPWCAIKVYRIDTDWQLVFPALPLWQVGSAYSYPEIVPWVEDPANWDGKFLVTFLRASSTIFPEVRGAILEPNLAWNPSFLIQPGTSSIDNGYYHNRWGDYITAQARLDQGTKEVWLHAHVGEGGLYGNRVFQLVNDILGCTDPGGCNYNAEATLDDGGCTYSPCWGCMIEGACNYNPNADVAGYCQFAGCTNPFAANYSSFADCDNGSCCYSNFISLQMTDSYGDGWNGATYTLTDPDGEVVASGTMSGGSESVHSIGCNSGGCLTLEVTNGIYPMEIGWEVRQTTSSIFFGGPNTVVLASGGANTTTTFVVGDGGDQAGCTDPDACNFSSEALCDNGSCCYANCLAMHMTSSNSDGWLSDNFYWNIQDVQDQEFLASGRMDTYGTQIDSLCLSDGCYEIIYTPENYIWSSVPIDLVFGEDTLVTGGWTVDPPPTFSLGEVLSIQEGGAGGCTDIEACNYSQAAICDDGSCCYDGCATLHVLTHPGGTTTFSFYEFDSWTITGTGDTTFCLPSGCHQLTTTGNGGGVWWLETADGEYSNGIGEPAIIAIGGQVGCMDEMACNFNADAICEDESCEFPACDDPAACNFVPDASCYASFTCAYSCFGCTYDSALNFMPEATVDDGTCEFPTVGTPDCMEDLDADGVVGVNDLLLLLASFGDACG